MARWRSWVGMLLILLPLLCVGGMIALGVLLGSMGMDIHWKSRAMFSVTVSALVAGLAACVALGVKLRKAGKQQIR